MVLINKIMSTILCFFLLLVQSNIKCQPSNSSLSNIKTIDMVITINGKAGLSLWPLFIKYKNGLQIDTLKGIYNPGRIEFNLDDFTNFYNLEHDSIIIQFESWNTCSCVSDNYYIYSFKYFQSFFDSYRQAFAIERVCIKYYREKYLHKWERHKYKGGYIVVYDVDNINGAAVKYLRKGDD
jgi:hypothetical protein